MVSHDKLLKNLREEKNRIQNEIKELEEDIFKYRSRGDFSAATHCIEKKGRRKADLSEIENEISRLERIIENGGVDPYAPAVTSNNSLNYQDNLPIDDGTIKTTMTMDIEFKGTKGDKKDIHQTHSQTVTRHSEIKNNQVVSQISTVDTNSSKQTIKSSKNNIIDTISKSNSSAIKPRQSPKRTTNFITANEIRERQIMELFISNFKKGNSWNKSAKLSNVTPRKAAKWYRQGLKDFSKNTKYFYNQINYIEKHGLRDKNEILPDNKVNSFSKNKRDERKKMQLFINYLKKGFSWEKSAELSNIPSTQAVNWYRFGFKNLTENTTYFYNQIKELNISPNLINTNVSNNDSGKVSGPEIKDGECVDDVIDVKVIEEKKTIINDEDLIDDKKAKMNLIIFNLKEGKSLKKASDDVGISINIVNNWIVNGKKGVLSYVDFYNEFNQIKSEQEHISRCDESRILKTKQISQILKQLRKGKTKIQACEIVDVNISDFNKWYNEGKYGNGDENVDLYKQVNEIKQMHTFLNEFKKTNSAHKTSISYKQYLKWINDGNNNVSENTIWFVKELTQIKKGTVKPKPKPQNKTPSLLDKNQKTKMDKVLSERKSGITIVQATKKHNIPISTVTKWYEQGKEKYSENTIYFYQEMQKIENKDEFNQMSALLAALMRYGNKKEACKVTGIPSSKLDLWINQARKGENKNAEYFVREYEKLNLTDDYNSREKNKQNFRLCPNCNKMIDVNQNYCNFCGYKLKVTKQKKQSIFDKIRGLF